LTDTSLYIKYTLTQDGRSVVIFELLNFGLSWCLQPTDIIIILFPLWSVPSYRHFNDLN